MISILIVDDEHLLRKALKEIIRSVSDEFIVIGDADNGYDALEIIAVNKPDLALLDIRMPEMSGIELAGRIKEESPATMIVFLTGYADFSYARQAIRIGVMDYILKPVKKELLSELLVRLRKQIYGNAEQYVAEKIYIDSDNNLIIDNSIIAKYNLTIPERQKCRGLTIKALEFIYENYAHDLNLYRVSSMVHVSKNYFCTNFKSDTGLSFPHFINIYRLEKAEQFMKIHPELKLYEIADMVGFKDPKYLSQVFKKMTGLAITSIKNKSS